MEEKKRRGAGWWDVLLKMIKGAVIGTGAILPGISGGVLCVVLGIYKPLMDFLAHPFKDLKKQILYFWPLGVGFALGVLGLAKLVEWLFHTSAVPAIWLFIGLVVGTLPSLFREAGEQGRGAKAWIAMGLSFVLMLALLILMSGVVQAKVTPSILWFLICGVMWGIGLVVPGMSPSSFFIYLGLYEPIAAGIGNLDFGVLLPMGGGLLAAVLLLAKLMKRLLERAYAATFHAIFGIVVASTLAIIPLGTEGTQLCDWVASALRGTVDSAAFSAGLGNSFIFLGCFVLGVAVAYGMDVLGKKWGKKEA